MGTKRPHDSEIHPSRRTQVPLSSKKRKVNPHPHRKLEPSNHAINPLKSRIRDLKRLLAHKENLPMDVRLNHERELVDCDRDLEAAEREKRKGEMIGKYHMVRFFDRQKATRKLKQMRKKAKETLGTGEAGTWEDEVHKAEVDVNYAQFYPLDVAYSALYPSKGKKRKGGDDSEGGNAEDKVEERLGDPKMWAKIEECMESDRLDKLRNGKLMKELVAEGIVKEEVVRKVEKKVERSTLGKTDKKIAKAKAKETKAVVQEEDEDSDGGFFE